MLSTAVLTIIGVVGLSLLLIFVLFDGLFDFFGGEPILPSAAFFTAIFGFSGALANTIAPENEIVMLVTPFAVGALSTIFFYLAYRSFHKIAAADEKFVADPTTMVGKTATVSWWDENHGEVLVSYLGQTRKTQAFSDEPINAASTVYVIEVVSASQVKVSASKPA